MHKYGIRLTINLQTKSLLKRLESIITCDYAVRKNSLIVSFDENLKHVHLFIINRAIKYIRYDLIIRLNNA